MSDREISTTPPDLAEFQVLLEQAADLEANNNYYGLLSKLNILVDKLEQTNRLQSTDPAYLTIALSSYAFRAVTHARFIGYNQANELRDTYMYSALYDMETALDIDPQNFAHLDTTSLRMIIQNYEYIAEAGSYISPLSEDNHEAVIEQLVAVTRAYRNLIFLLQVLGERGEMEDYRIKSESVLINYSNAAARLADLLKTIDLNSAIHTLGRSVISLTSALSLVWQARENEDPRRLSELMMLTAGRSISLGHMHESALANYANIDENNAWQEWQTAGQNLPLPQLVASPDREANPWYTSANQILQLLNSDMRQLDSLQTDERCQAEYALAWLYHEQGDMETALMHCAAVLNLAKAHRSEIVSLQEFDSPANKRQLQSLQRISNNALSLISTIDAGGNSGAWSEV